MTKQFYKPCPFCSYSKPSLVINEYSYIPELGVESHIKKSIICPNCLAIAPIDRWNIRKINNSKKGK